jgi:hypothetical protein
LACIKTFLCRNPINVSQNGIAVPLTGAQLDFCAYPLPDGRGSAEPP